MASVSPKILVVVVALLGGATSAAKLRSNDRFSSFSRNLADSSYTIRGVPGKDYPILASVPFTVFRCKRRVPGYYADTAPVAGCQVFHICQEGGQRDSFLCPNGTIFNQQYFVCDNWDNVDCAKSRRFYSLNEELGKIKLSENNGGSVSSILSGGLGGSANSGGTFGSSSAFSGGPRTRTEENLIRFTLPLASQGTFGTFPNGNNFGSSPVFGGAPGSQAGGDNGFASPSVLQDIILAPGSDVQGSATTSDFSSRGAGGVDGQGAGVKGPGGYNLQPPTQLYHTPAK
ncbi:uncharacterized protein LOC121870913 [Homarus americanus]|uniref:U-scoloptoxin(01)-Er1a-like 4 n=1 Tax=Homarus americanus TaxID=6706 RepID=A0A8J5MVW7_HOMAM|nr:uncharacterized protein LOC121870913 [Homarus americanus]KAG7164989.1 U-scoloptoxin(01)-Er1a-like 4 [Homarus americanus]